MDIILKKLSKKQNITNNEEIKNLNIIFEKIIKLLKLYILDKKEKYIPEPNIMITNISTDDLKLNINELLFNIKNSIIEKNLIIIIN